MMMKTVIQLVGPLLTLIGCGLSIYGTFLVARSYHPFRAKQFWITILKTLGMTVTFRVHKAIEFIRLAAEIATNKEDRAVSLVGYFLIFWGFFFQSLGAIFWGIDVLMGLAARVHP
jgi:hypothetical protein